MLTDFDDVGVLQRNHAAWKLLRAEYDPLILAFLGKVTGAVDK